MYNEIQLKVDNFVEMSSDLSICNASHKTYLHRDYVYDK